MPTTITATVETITPEIAAEMLKRNITNRSLKPQAIARYARDIEAGEWLVTNSGIGFDRNGTLVDGQNRLHAVLLAEMSVEVLVVRNLDPRSRNVIDDGVKRTGADVLKMRGTALPETTAAVATRALAWAAGAIRVAGKWAYSPSHSEVLDIVAKDPHITRAAEIGVAYGKGDNRLPVATAATIGFAAWLALTAGASYEDVDDFYRSMRDSQTTGPGDPRLAVLRRLQVAEKRDQRLTMPEQAFILVRGWNAYRKGEPLHAIRFIANGRQIPLPLAAG